MAMAGLISRLKRITVSRIEEFLKTVEAPEVVFPELIREMQGRIRDAVSAESKAASAFKANQRRLDESIGRSIRLGKGAEMALRQGDEALAREALAEQIRVDRGAEDQRLALQQSEAALLQAREGRLRLQSQIEELKRREKEILARARLARSEAQRHEKTEPLRARDSAILDEISRTQPVDDGSPFALPDMVGRSLEERLRALEREAEIERRLASIRNRKQSISKQGA
jgi:phage shock protein A